MATLEVKINKMESYAGELRKLASALRRMDRDIDSCNKKVNTAVSTANYNVKRTLNRISDSFVADIQTIEKMAQVLESAAALYKNTERNVCNIHVKIEEPERAKDSVTIFWESFADLIMNIIGTAGISGSIVDVIWDALNADDITESLLDVASWLTKTTGAVLKEVGEDIPDWFGALTGFTDDVYKSVDDYLSSVIDDFWVGTTKTASKVGSVVANWLSVIVEGAINFKGNMEEFGEDAFSNLRFWQETAIETIFDVGKTVLVSAGVVFVAGLVGLTPAGWAVALISGTIVVAGDMTFEFFKGEDMTEAFTDYVLDGGDKTNNNVGEAVVSTYDAVSVAWAG